MNTLAKPKKVTVGQMKKKVWKVFSEYIRTRDCLKTTGERDNGICVTCGKVYGFKQLQAGHWLPGRHNAVLYDQRNCHAQCYHCNVGLKGNPVKYFRYMQEHYGEDVLKELEAKDNEPYEYKVYQLEAIKEHYKTLLEAI